MKGLTQSNTCFRETKHLLELVSHAKPMYLRKYAPPQVCISTSVHLKCASPQVCTSSSVHLYKCIPQVCISTSMHPASVHLHMVFFYSYLKTTQCHFFRLGHIGLKLRTYPVLDCNSSPAGLCLYTDGIKGLSCTLCNPRLF